MQARNQRAFTAGLLFVAISLVFFILSFGYEHGTITAMGPGFFPAMVSIFLGLIGVSVMIGALVPATHIEKLQSWDFTGLAWISGSVVFFALLLPTMGLVVSLMVLVIIASLASPEFRWPGAIVNAIFLTAFCVIVFGYAINLQFPLWPVWLG